MLQYLEQFNLLSVFVRLALSTVLGGLIGLERGSHGQPAGLRTFALVCLGATIAMITDEYLVVTYGTGDPARLAAQVISGIGFLGVGTIIVTGKNYVKGLTTAASLWTPPWASPPWPVCPWAPAPAIWTPVFWST